MPKPKKGARLGGSASHQRHILSNLASALFEHGQIKTTEAKAKVLRPYAEKLITRARGGSLHDIRIAAKEIRSKDILNKLFEEIGPKFADRDGGYTRIVKVEPRRGDNAKMAVIQLVDEPVAAKKDDRAARVAASKATEETKAEEAVEVEADPATDAAAEAEAVEAEEKKED